MAVFKNNTDLFKFVEKSIKDEDEAGLLAAIERQPDVARVVDHDGESILYKVLANGFDKRIVYTLLNQGADPGRKKIGQNIPPIWQACSQLYPDEVILTLLGYGPAMNLKEQNNVNPFFCFKQISQNLLSMVQFGRISLDKWKNKALKKQILELYKTGQDYRARARQLLAGFNFRDYLKTDPADDEDTDGSDAHSDIDGKRTLVLGHTHQDIDRQFVLGNFVARDRDHERDDDELPGLQPEKRGRESTNETEITKRNRN
jgi:hypothetical protein